MPQSARSPRAVSSTSCASDDLQQGEGVTAALTMQSSAISVRFFQRTGCRSTTLNFRDVYGVL